jgi:alkyl sulfatase BDS1-like metallo-beta-lactamase superfamily hydrolase
MTTPLYRTRPGGFDIQPACMPEARRLTDFLYMSEGLSTSYLVVTDEGRVVVNTGMGFEAPIHKRNYDAVDDGPVRYILLTQGHVDHVGGVDLFCEPGTEIVAHEGNRGYQDEDQLLRRARSARSGFAFAKAIGAAARYAEEGSLAAAAQSSPTPTITFRERYEFEFGDVRFELLAVPGGETTESMAIWLPQHRICLAGNMFSALFGHVPNLVTIRGDRYRDALLFIESLERVLNLEPELLLVGHGPPIEGAALIRSELERLRDAVQYLHDETVRYMNSDADVFTAMREIRLPEELTIGEGYGKLSWCVQAIWENYLGWFHHQSTTELYPVPASSVHGDLVDLAGGPEALAKRAREKLDSGLPVEAIHLAEIALVAAPDHRGALEVCLGAHEVLEAESENFWLSSWLRRRIDALAAEVKQ